MKFLIVACVFLKVALSQTLCRYQQPISETISIETSLTGDSESCKNLAVAIQNVVMSNLRKNAAKSPIFGAIAPPLLDEIVKNLNCECPACKKYLLSPNSPITNLITTPCDNSNSLVPRNTINGLLTSANSAVGKANIFTNSIANSLTTVMPCGCNSPCSCSNANSLLNSLNSLLPCGCNSVCSCSNVLSSKVPVVNTQILPCGCQNNACGCSLLSTPASCPCQNTLSASNLNSFVPSNAFVGLLDTSGNIVSNSLISGSLSGNGYSDIVALLNSLPTSNCACRNQVLV